MFDGIPGHPAPLACGTFRLDLARRELRDARAWPVRLRGKTFDVLHVLLHRAGRLVTRRELLDLVWGEVHVTDDSVTQCVVEIRRALGAEAGVALRTVARHGYLLDIAAPAAAGSLGVPPFSAADAGCARLGEALAAELRVVLARQAGLRVLAGRGGAALVLEGNLRPLGRRLRVTAQLLEAATGLVLWAERYDCPPAAAEEPAAEIAAAVRARLAAA